MSLGDRQGDGLSPPSDLVTFLEAQFKYCDDDSILGAGESINPERMFGMVSRSRFRRTKLDPDSRADIMAKIHSAFDRWAPIEFAIPFGAYKHWRAPTYPFPDWAEVFNLKHLIAFAGPIARDYPPGVVLNYTYTSGVLETINNFPNVCQQEYLTALTKLHSYFQEVSPRGLQLRLVDIRELYLVGELEAELERNYSENLRCWKEKYSDEVLERKLTSARNNLVLNGTEDLRGLSIDELERRFLESAMWCDALDCLILRRGFNKYGRCIQLVFVRGPSASLHIGSCRTSNAHVGIGVGIVERRDKLLIESIVPTGKAIQLFNEGGMKEVIVKGCSPVSLESLQRVFMKL